MKPFDILQARPFGFTRDETAAYRDRILEDVRWASSGWIMSSSLSLPAHRQWLRSFDWTSEIPREAVCICVDGIPCLWRREWLRDQLSEWNSRLPAARFLQDDLMPNDANQFFRMEMPASAGSGMGGSGSRNITSRMPLSQLHDRECIVPLIAATKQKPPHMHDPSQQTASSVTRVKPAVSILMSVHNMRDTMGWSIRSVLAQSSEDWELIIGDDASDDDSLEEACFYSDPRIKILLHSRNRGKAVMMNRLLEEARGRYILELDGDDWLAPDTVRLLSEALDQAPEAGMATALYGWWIRTRQMGPVWKGTISSANPPEQTRSSRHFAQAHPLVPRMYRAASLKAVGGWWDREDRFGRIFEDIDLTSRLLEHHLLVQVPAVLYHRVIYGSSISQRSGDLFPAWQKSR
ncbi:glycosyl transferase family 2 [Paenibacillus ihbetae]|uniref:Glycosyl transferase family 2 n=1 Tax=Paenibacillus ihbetae TaxID=1870820 RepID=A0A1B2E650_9BACL|nr:glycosyltransferase family A protein [Paenibacillus ihbetae]ANY75443.1 glycosyl transferase family 2 [Paenibacillus ihbetae]